MAEQVLNPYLPYLEKVLSIVSDKTFQEAVKAVCNIIAQAFRKWQDGREKEKQEKEEQRRKKEEMEKLMSGQAGPEGLKNMAPDELERLLESGIPWAGFVLGRQCMVKGNVDGALMYFFREYNLNRNLLCAYYIAMTQYSSRKYSEALDYLEKCWCGKATVDQCYWTEYAPDLKDLLWSCCMIVGGDENTKKAVPLMLESAAGGLLEAQMALGSLYAKKGTFYNPSEAMRLLTNLKLQEHDTRVFDVEMMIGTLILKTGGPPKQAIKHLKSAKKGYTGTLKGEACYLLAIAKRRLKEDALEMEKRCSGSKEEPKWHKKAKRRGQEERSFIHEGAHSGNVKCMALSQSKRDLLCAAQTGDIQAMYRYGLWIRRECPGLSEQYIQQARLNGYQSTDEDKEFADSLPSDDDSESDMDSD